MRAYRKVIAQQSEPQRADLNVHNNVSTICHTKYSFTIQVCVASITQLLIIIERDFNSFKVIANNIVNKWCMEQSFLCENEV